MDLTYGKVKMDLTYGKVKMDLTCGKSGQMYLVFFEYLQFGFYTLACSWFVRKSMRLVASHRNLMAVICASLLSSLFNMISLQVVGTLVKASSVDLLVRSLTYDDFFDSLQNVDWR